MSKAGGLIESRIFMPSADFGGPFPCAAQRARLCAEFDSLQNPCTAGNTLIILVNFATASCMTSLTPHHALCD